MEELLNTLSFEEIKKDCFNLLDFLSGPSQPIESKQCACHIYVILSNYMTYNEFIESFITNIRNLCDDFNWQIRKAMCQSMKDIILKYKDTPTASILFSEELIVLLSDTDEEVRLAALHTFYGVFGIYINSPLRGNIVSIIWKTIQAYNDRQLLIILQSIGLIAIDVIIINR